MCWKYGYEACLVAERANVSTTKVLFCVSLSAESVTSLSLSLSLSRSLAIRACASGGTTLGWGKAACQNHQSLTYSTLPHRYLAARFPFLHFYLSHFNLFFGFDILCACVSREDLTRAIPVKSATAQARNDVNDLVHSANPLQRRVALAQCDGCLLYTSDAADE